MNSYAWYKACMDESDVAWFNYSEIPTIINRQIYHDCAAEELAAYDKYAYDKYQEDQAS